MRHTCLACGWCFETEQRPQICPYCHDRYFCDNVLPDIPPPLGQNRIKCWECNAEFVVESITDWNMVCPICLYEHKSFRAEYVGKQLSSFKDYQEKILKEKGVI